MINNKIDSIFGTVGVFAGWIILAFGIYSCFYSLIGISTVIVGLFLAFTNTSTKIDFENRKAKFSNNLFGIFSVGYWTDITSGMSLSLQKTTKSQNIFAFSNQKTTNTAQDYRIMLINEKGIAIMPLKKFDKKEDAENEIAELTKKLKITS
ncbi:MAG: hypothetical protein JXR36_15650 [Bacteroidales bacterium]|nr:hypothetical protein [Bacteroidales bacterium]